MHKFLSLATLVVTLVVTQPLSAQDEAGNPPPQFDKYWMVYLVRGDQPPELSEAESAELQRQHLAHLSKVWKSGHALVAGPFEVAAEDPMRGIVLYRGDLEVDQVCELAEADPAVKAGRLKVEIRRWWTGGGVLQFRNAEELAALNKSQASSE